MARVAQGHVTRLERVAMEVFETEQRYVGESNLTHE